MKLGKMEAKITDELIKGKKSLGELALALAIKKPNASKSLKKLSECGLVRTWKEGKRAIAELDSWLASGFASATTNFIGLKISDILVGRTPYFLSYAHERKEFRLSDLDMPQASAKRLLGLLRRQGLLSMPNRGIYRLRVESEPIGALCKQLVAHVCYARAAKVLGSIESGIFSYGSVNGVQAVFVSCRKSKGTYWPTAYSVLERFGVETIPSGKYYYTNSEPDAGDVMIHLLALDRGARGVSFAAAVALRSGYDVAALLKKRQDYGLGSDYLLGFAGFVKGKEGFAGLQSLDDARVV